MTEAQIAAQLVSEAMNRETVPYGSDENYDRISDMRDAILIERRHQEWERAGRPVIKYTKVS